MKPRISVLMPVYNAELYVGQAIESILNQTFSDFELIIINDGSSDDSLSIIEGYSQRDKRIKVISRGNKGLVYSLNEGIELAQGEYIARMDADDISIYDRFRIQLKAISEQNIDIVGGFIRYIGGRFDGRIEEYPITNSDIRFRLIRGCAIAHPTAFIRATVLKENLYKSPIINRDNENGFSEDYDLWTRLAIKEYKFGNVPEVLLSYRVSPSQYTRKYSKKQMESTIYTASNYSYFQYGIPMQQTAHFGFGEKSEGQNGKLTEYVTNLIRIAKELGVSKRWIQVVLFEVIVQRPFSERNSLKLLLKLFSHYNNLLNVRLLAALLFKRYPDSENNKVLKKLLKIVRRMGFRI